MNTLQEVIKNKKPIKVYLDNEYWCDMEYNEKENRYEGQFGNIPMEVIPKVLAGNKEYDHIRIEAL